MSVLYKQNEEKAEVDTSNRQSRETGSVGHNKQTKD
jgi:hypothetical protein